MLKTFFLVHFNFFFVFFGKSKDEKDPWIRKMLSLVIRIRFQILLLMLYAFVTRDSIYFLIIVEVIVSLFLWVFFIVSLHIVCCTTYRGFFSRMMACSID